MTASQPIAVGSLIVRWYRRVASTVCEAGLPDAADKAGVDSVVRCVGGEKTQYPSAWVERLLNGHAGG